jgi:deoxyribonuclease-2
MAKNKQWNKDFYNDLVGPALHDDLEIETWLHHAMPSLVDSDKVHRIQVMKAVDLAPVKVPFSWSDEVDHAKLAISHPSEATPWVCVGDINFTTSMRNRGGGTLAFQNADLWKNLDEILSDREEPKPGKHAPAASASRRGAAAKPAKRRK